jgi:hypothetical protein
MRTVASKLETNSFPSGDLSGVRRLHNDTDGGLQPGIVDDDLDFHLGHEVDAVFGAAVHLVRLTTANDIARAKVSALPTCRRTVRRDKRVFN